MAKKAYNCHVTAICSGRNAEFVRQMGADDVVDYTTLNVSRELLERRRHGSQYDLYIDCVGGTDLFGTWV